MLKGGFFEAASQHSKSQTLSTIPKCGACGLLNKCKTPKMPIHGKGKKRILIVTEAPTYMDDVEGELITDGPIRLLRDTLRGFDIDLDEDCWLTHSIICHPEGGREPTNKEIDYCQPNITKAIRDLEPISIVPMGQAAVRSVLGPYWKENVGSVSEWVGWRIPLQKINTCICPTYSAKEVIEKEKKSEGPAMLVWLKNHLSQLQGITDRPWKEVPDYQKEINIELDPNEAARKIRKITELGGVTAFDFETTHVKPDRPEAEIVCCSICWRGRRTISYPWLGEVIVATGEYLRSDVPKVGANAGFENRWTYKEFGHFVNNFVADCVLDAHILDNRQGITGVKFNSFVLLGQEPYNDHIEPYLTSSDENGKNRIKELGMSTLCLYCGMDSLLEYKIAEIQHKEMKNGWT